MAFSPVLIDTATFGNAPSDFTQIVFGNKLYAFLDILTGGVGYMGAFQSTDGTVWTELDQANRPANLNSRFAFFDGAQTVIVGVREAGIAPQPLKLQNFNLLTGTWGPVYGTAGAPSSGAIAQGGGVFQRPDATIVIISSPRQGSAAPFAAGPPTGFQVDVYDPGSDTWAASIDAGTNIAALAGWDPTTILLNMSQAVGCLDGTGRIHIVLNTISVTAGWGNRVFYQAIETDNSLGSFFDFPNQEVPYATAPNAGHQGLEVFQGPPFGTPVINTLIDTIMLPVSATNRVSTFPRQIPCLYLGSPVSAPVWSVDLTKSIDPDVFTFTDDPFWMEAPNLVSDGTVIFAVGTAQDAAGIVNFARLRLANTFNLASPADGWAAWTAFDLATDSPPGFNFVGQQCLLASVRLDGTPFQILLSMDAKVPPAGPTEARYWMGNFTLPLTIACGSPPDGMVGVPYSHQFPAGGV